MKKYLIANWKCNFTKKELSNYFNEFDNIKTEIKLGFAVPSIFLMQAKAQTSLPILAQDIEAFGYGSHTGRVSYQHLLDTQINGVIIGHSEQRVFNDNTNEIIQKKVAVALANNFDVFLCCGEPLEVYEKNETKKFIKAQLDSALKDVDLTKVKDHLVIAYEPIWAIGTGKIPTNDVIDDIAKFIKDTYHLDVLYGGSVNEKNIQELRNITNINGFLIGSASIDPKIFINIINNY